jgi:hypothetical protein
MAFKMKGSPHKMGKIQGTAGYASALKQATEKKSKFEKQAEEKGEKVRSRFETQTVKEGKRKSKFDKLTEEEGKVKSPNEMKSPLEQKKIIEGLKKFGKKVKEFGDKYNTGEKVGEAVKKAVKKKVAEYKPKSETTTSKEVIKGQTKNKGKEDEYSQDKVKVTAKTKRSKKKLFGGKKETTSSSSKTYDQDTYADGDVERGWDYEPERGVTTTTHSRNKRRGGGKKKVVTVDQNTGKKTVTRYRKDGSVKSTKVKKGDHRTSNAAERKAIRDENKGK